MKKIDKRINKDIEALKGDLRRVRDDLVAKLRSRRQRGSEVVAAGGPVVREVVTEVRERPAWPDEYRQRPRRRSARRLAVFFALGTAAILLARRRAAVGADVSAPGRWRRRLAVRLPWTRRSRRTGIEAEAYEPTVRVPSSPDREVTVVREESAVP
jgi:hypothetical protein